MKLNSSEWSQPSLQLHARTLPDSLDVQRGKQDQGKSISTGVPTFDFEIQTDPVIYYEVPGAPGEYQGQQPIHLQITSNASQFELDDITWRLHCRMDSLRSSDDTFDLERFQVRVAGQGEYAPLSQPLVVLQQTGMQNPQQVDLDVKFLVSLGDRAGDYNGGLTFELELVDEVVEVE